ncbi:NHLP family bacteriocin export ABC transporter peptidase/permease/ATPase subunit [uncultured Robinsoniella sp.]|uniref:NHLP family bacteriocin export ABC transporter peptidase/permease/ATPase subunit n=1 Tax=uncultured Robinsoniella sp. TaxID=904190 RepID=UPI00374E7182
MADKQKKCVKVPVVMQMEALECGAACLTMIMAYYKKWVPLEQVRVDCGVSRDGSKASNMAKAAGAYGLQVKAHRYSVESVCTKVSYPAIIHWNFNHFVVLNGFKRGKAIINDPARGVVEISPEEFDKSFTGVCLEFEPGEQFVADGKKESVIEFAKKRLQGSKLSIVFVMMTTVLTAFVSLLTPVFSRIFTDNILTGQNTQWLSNFLAFLAVIILFLLVVGMINEIYIYKIKGKMAIVSNSSFIWHTLHLPMTFFSQRMAGDIASRQLLNDDIAETLVGRIAPMLINMMLLIFYLIIMLRYSVVLSLVGFAAIAVNLVLANIISQKRIHITRTQMRDQGKLDASTVSGIEMIETIKSAGAESGFFERWSGFQASLNKAKVEFALTNQFLGGIPALVQQLSGIIILALGVWMIIKGNFTVGMLLAFQSYMTQFLMPVNDLLETGQKLQEMRTSMERVDDVMKYKEDVVFSSIKNTDEVFEKLDGSMEFRNVTFGYSRLEEPLLKDFNLTLKSGSKVALVGSSGCGKSTIAKLACGLYEPWSGEILFQGKPMKDIPKEIFNSSLSVVDQDITMFEDSISDNIKMWDKSIEDFEMIMAARDAQIHSDIMTRKGGYGHQVSEGGKNFSGGQRQRFEIARVLAQDPTIAILDEATSALDAKTEYEVVKAIQKRGITCIIVAHRLSTIRDCDEIIVLDHGRVMERGTHEELYQLNGYYTRLITTE